MKKIVVLLFIGVYFHTNSQPIFSEKGYPEHFIAGALIGGATSYIVYNKTGNKFKAWAFGTLTATAVGVLKEAIDPELLSGVRNSTDTMYTGLGGIVGASIVFPLKKRKPKETPNISAAFKNEIHLEFQPVNSD
ncbi:MAG: hypothetical protein HKN90_08585 [Flavobacteriaceae bacterium]|nr:hypothetical protein [Flavobacteriaceae bacterium]